MGISPPLDCLVLVKAWSVSSDRFSLNRICDEEQIARGIFHSDSFFLPPAENARAFLSAL